jgi:hypothetical protein
MYSLAGCAEQDIRRANLRVRMSFGSGVSNLQQLVVTTGFSPLFIEHF